MLLPDEVTLDTSFVLNALLTAEPHHAAAGSFIEQLADAEALLVFNRLLEIELREVAFRTPLIERYPGDWKRRRHDGRSLRRASRLIQQTMEAWHQLLGAFDYLLVELEEVHGRIDEFMDRFGLGSYDAVHAATAQYSGVRTMITTDAGFAAVPASRLTIYTNASRVGPCRRMRPRTHR